MIIIGGYICSCCGKYYEKFFISYGSLVFVYYYEVEF